jgi:hypothetical protein
MNPRLPKVLGRKTNYLYSAAEEGAVKVFSIQGHKHRFFKPVFHSSFFAIHRSGEYIVEFFCLFPLFVAFLT